MPAMAAMTSDGAAPAPKRLTFCLQTQEEEEAKVKDSRRTAPPRLEGQTKFTRRNFSDISKLLADDGRHRSYVLPPLEAEPSFHRIPRKVTSLHPFHDELDPSKKFKKISIEVDRKVVSHLRRSLNKRMEKRYHTLDEEEEDDDDAGDRRSRMSGREPVDGKLQIFAKYSDLGEKLEAGRRKSSGARPGLPLDPLPPSPGKAAPTQNGLPLSRKGTRDSRGSLIQSSPLPQISRTPRSDKESPRTHNSVESEDQNGLNKSTSADEEHTEDVENEGEEDSHDPDAVKADTSRGQVEETPLPVMEDFRNLPVSPLTTPSVSRPDTGDEAQLTTADRVLRIIRGHFHLRCPPDNKIIRMYLCSGFEETELERSALLTRVLPRLRGFCQEQGHELQLYDLHWGLKDAVTDDHRLPELCRHAIEACTRHPTGLCFVALLGEKYGAELIPRLIPQSEFEAVVRLARQFREQQTAEIRARLAEIEGARQERERQKKLVEVETESVATTLTDSEGVHSGRDKQALEEVESLVERDRFRQGASQVRKEASTIRMLKESEEDLPDVNAVEQWYQLDTNCVPPVYRLKNISSSYKDIMKSDAGKRQQAKANWKPIAAKILKVFQMFAPEAVKSREDLKKYFQSLPELELGAGLSDPMVALHHSLYIKRSISDVRSHVGDEAVRVYMDVRDPKPGAKVDTIDEARAARMTAVRDELVPMKVPDSATVEFNIEWQRGGVRVSGYREHTVYLERMCKAVHDRARRLLAEEFKDELKVSNRRYQLFSEVAQHAALLHERGRRVQGRKEVLQVVRGYLRSCTQFPLVLYGGAGCGKTALLARAARNARKWMQGSDVRVLARSIGTTFDSTNIRVLLRSLCLQLCEIFGNNPHEIPSDYKGLVNDFGYRMSQASEDVPLLIVLDGLDRLADEHEGRKVGWLPRFLPENVHMILSTLPDDKYEVLGALRKVLEGRTACLLEVPPFPAQDAWRLTEHWLQKERRRLTQHQMSVLTDAFHRCPTPLYLKMAFAETLTWPSFQNPEQAKLMDSARKLAAGRFARLERDHGEPLVRRALGYITAARSGITSNELEDVLSLDEAVMDDVTSSYQPSLRRLPSVLWTALRHDLEDMLQERGADNVRTLCWAHAQFFEAAEERYLNQRDKAPSYHKALAEYFLGLWVDKPKPYTGREAGALRHVTPQPLYFEPEGSPGDGSDRIYNLRKINELPFHLFRAQQMDVLKKEVLCNFEWVLAKLCGTSLRALLEEYQVVLQAEPNDHDLRTLSDTIHLSSAALLSEPRQLSSQVVGRLRGILDKDVPKAPKDPVRFPLLHRFLEQAMHSSLPALVANVQCLTEPGGILYDLLSGHTEPITAIALTNDGLRALTASMDNTLKLWDIRTGKVTKTLEGVGTNVSLIRVAKSNNMAATRQGTVIRVWNLRTCACVLTLDQYIDPAVLGTAGEGAFLVALFDGCNILRSWNLDSFKQMCEAEIPGEAIHKDRSILVADYSYTPAVLHAFRSANEATVQHCKSGQVLMTLQCQEKSSSVVALTLTRDYFVLASRQQYMKLHEVHQMELFEAKGGKLLRAVRGCVHDNVSDVYVNLMGSHALAVCASARNNTSDIALWNLETEEHKHLARHPKLSTLSACLDFRFCLTAAKGDNTLRIWNISTKVNQPAPKLEKSLGIIDILPMIDNPRYVVCKTINNGPISVWNVAKGKCLQNAVRIERGISADADVVVCRNTRLVILTDRGFSSVSEDSRPVFQTVLVYDLKAKRFERKLTGCYIVPAPSHEYVLLENDQMLGPSDNRTHFIIWNLLTGHVLHRIKTNFKELERRKLEAGLALTDAPRRRQAATATMTPWDRRAETDTAREERHQQEIEMERRRLEELRREKDNAVEQFVVSGDQNVIVASFFGHHLCVFHIPTRTHTQTLENENSMLFLHVSALTVDGSHLVHANYDEESKDSFVTLWDCGTGQVKRRLKKEANVMALGITDGGQRVVIGKAPDQLHIWDPMRSSSLRKVRGYSQLQFSVGSKIFMLDGGARCVVFAGSISVWDLEKAAVMAVFTPDTKIMCCDVVMNGQLVVFGLYEKQELIILRLMTRDSQPLEDAGGEDLFGELTSSSDDDSPTEEEEAANK